MEELNEISTFLDLNGRYDVKAIALDHILSYTNSAEGIDTILSSSDIVRQLVLLLHDKSVNICKNATMALVNLSACEAGASALVHMSESSKMKYDDLPNDNLVNTCLRHIIDKESALADPCCMIFSNLTRLHALVERIVRLLEQSGYQWSTIISAFTAKNYNSQGANLDYLGPVFSNLTQSATMRRYLMDRKKCIIQNLSPFTNYDDNIVRRGGIVGALKNCCFDEKHHMWLLGPDVDILPRLLLPLAGPEEFDDEDNDKLPVDLQYLPEDKTRESDPDIKVMLLEALAQLCATRNAREFLREKNTYVILREFHKSEKDRAVLLACENVVDILIKNEEEIGLDNLKEVSVPPEYDDQFKKMDADYLKDS